MFFSSTFISIGPGSAPCKRSSPGPRHRVPFTHATPSTAAPRLTAVISSKWPNASSNGETGFHPHLQNERQVAVLVTGGHRVSNKPSGPCQTFSELSADAHRGMVRNQHYRRLQSDDSDLEKVRIPSRHHLTCRKHSYYWIVMWMKAGRKTKSEWARVLIIFFLCFLLSPQCFCYFPLPTEYNIIMYHEIHNLVSPSVCLQTFLSLQATQSSVSVSAHTLAQYLRKNSNFCQI